MGMALGIGLGLGGLVSLGGGVPLPQYVFGANFADAPGKVPGFSYTRATVGAMVQQYDGSFVQPEIGEIPLMGGRRVDHGDATDYGFGVAGIQWFSTDEYGNDLTVEDALGPELVTNGGFDTDSDWNKSAGATITGGELVISEAGSVQNWQAFTKIGTFRVEIDVAEVSAGEVQSYFHGAIAAAPGQSISAPGVYVDDLTTATIDPARISVRSLGAPNAARINSISVREIYPVRCTGMARRPAITNLFEYSNDLSNAAWTKSSCAVSAGAGALGLPGSVVTPSAGTNAPHVYNSTTVVSATNYTLSVLLRGNGTRYVQVFNSVGFNSSLYQNFDLVDGTIEGGDSPIAASIEHVTGDVYLIKYTDVSTGTSGRIGIAQVDSGSATRLQTATWDGVDGIEILSSQFEIGSVANDHVPTTSTAVTVNAEAPALVPATIGYDQDGGVWVMAYTPSRLASTSGGEHRILELYDSANGLNNRILYYDTASTDLHTLNVKDGGTTVASFTGGAAVANTEYVAAIRAETNNFKLSVNGAAITSDLAGTIPGIDTIVIGSGISNSSTFAGAFSRLYYFAPGTLTDEQLLHLSAGNLPQIPRLT